MESKVATIATTPDPTFGQKPQTVRPESGTTEFRAPPGPDQVDLRLVIEEDSASGSYVYRTVNRATGEVVQQFPREDILKMRAEAKYVAGAIISAKA
jgi:flagellar protein FlaG